MKPRLYSSLWASILLAASIVAVPALALAGEPVTVPQPIFSEGFEGSLPQGAWLDYAVPSPGNPAPAYWGKITARKHAGAYGLWCAGTSTTSSTNGWTAFSGKYPIYTGALANFEVAQLANYYSASLDLWYTMPTLGTEDSGAFNVMWRPLGGVQWDSHYELPVSAGWSNLRFSLTAPPVGSTGRPIDLSRAAGEIRFNFIDSSGNVFESPANGEGVTIDDVTVSGFRYGPVRDLFWRVDRGEVALNWSKPAKSTALLALEDERDVAYRIWRSPNAQPYVWTELTTDRIGGTTFTDVAPLDGEARYIVQAWEPGMGAGYGEVDVNAGVIATVIPPVPVTSIDIVGGAPVDGVFTEIPTISVTRSTVKGTTFYRWDSEEPVATTAQSFSVAARDGLHTLEVYSTNTLGTAETPHVVRTVNVHLPVPAPAPVTSIAVTGTVDAAGTFTSTPTITVTRDIAGGTTYYRWDDNSYVATTAASFTVSAVAGTHTLEAYSTAGGSTEAPTVTRRVTFVVPPAVTPTKPTLSTPTLSTSYPRRNRSFYIRGTVKPTHSEPTVVKVILYRYYSGSYHFVKTYTITLAAGKTSFSQKVTPSKTGTYRVKTQHGCPLHIPSYSGYKKFSVHS